MSQAWKSCDDFSSSSSSQKRSQLNELVKFFTDKSGSFQSTTCYQEMNDEDFTVDLDTYLAELHTECLIESDYRDTMDNLIVLLQKFPDELMSDTRPASLVSTVHYSLFLVVKESVSRIVKDLYYDNQQIVADLSKVLASLDTLFKYLVQAKQDNNQASVNIILVASLNSLLIVNKYTSKSSTVDLERKCSEILIKIYDLIDKKLFASFCLEANSETTRKICFLTLYFVINVKDARTTVSMWKVLSRLVITTKFFIQDADSSRTVSFLFRLFNKLCTDISANLTFIRASLEKLNEPSSSSTSTSGASSQKADVMQSQSMLSSQMTFMNNALSDTNKVIKLSLFLFKIFKSYSLIYMDLLWASHESGQVFSGLCNLMSLAGFILLYELKPREVYETMADRSSESKENWNESLTVFKKLKQSFTTDISPFFEELLQRLEKDTRFQEHLVREDGFQKINLNQEDEIDWKRVQQNLLFYTVLFNRMIRCDLTVMNDQQYVCDFLHQIFYYIDTSLGLFSVPDYFSISESFASKFDFTSLATSSTTLHFYDLIRFNLLRCLVNSKASTMLYFLCNNLLIKPSLKHSFRLQMSQELLVDYVELNLNTNEPFSVSLLKMYSDFYELSSNEQADNLCFRSVVINSCRAVISSMTQMKAKRIITQLEQYYTSKKYFLCFSIFFTDQLTESQSMVNSNDFSISYMKHLVDFYSNLKTSDSVKTSQLALLNLNKNISFETTSQTVNQLAQSLIENIREYLDRKLFTDSVKVRFTQILEASIPIYCKLIVKLSRLDDADLLLTHLLKSFDSLSINLKFQLVNMIFMLLNSSTRLPESITSKITDVLYHVLGESRHDQLRIYCLEYLCESMSSSASVSSILRQLAKKNKSMHEQINDFLVDTNLNMTIDEEKDYLDRKLASLCDVIGSQRTVQQCQLDDTMTAIMGAMDGSSQPSKSKIDQDDEDDELRIELEQALSNTELELDNLSKTIQMYKSKNSVLPVDLKNRLTSLAERMSRF